MRSFEFLPEQNLNETFVNAFKPEQKQKYVDQVWDILQSSYHAIGGIKGTGFNSKEDMIKNVPFWKLGIRGGKVRSVVMYKDKGGRKTVAVGTDRSPESKVLLKDMLRNEFERSFGEKSGPLLNYLKRNFPKQVEKYTIPPEKAGAIIGKSDIEPTDDQEYYRTISGTKMKKRMIGTPGKTIK